VKHVNPQKYFGAKMFQEAISVADQLATKIGIIKNQRDNRRVRIANFFDKVGTCLEKIVKSIDANESANDPIEELETYVESFSIAVGDIIGFELTERLVESLRIVFNKENFKKLLDLPEQEMAESKKTLKLAATKFVNLWSALQ
tara:strand:- start:1392 stop:1823 length:432 start_codon:yes stop_codon:yes gene_type:complete